MEYQQFVIKAFEIRRGNWRARISRRDGAPLALKGQELERECVTGSDEKNAADALLVAMDMIDWGTVSIAVFETVRRTRDATGEYFPVEHVGLDGKTYSLKQRITDDQFG